MWILLKPFLPAILIATAIVALVLIAAARLAVGRDWACVVALVAGDVTGHAVAVGRWPAFPPLDSIDWLPYFALGTLIFPILDLFLARSHQWLRLLIWTIFSALFLGALLQPRLRYGWSHAEALLWLGGILAVMLFLAWCFETIAIRSSARIALPLLLAIITGGSAIALLVSGSVLLGELAMILEAIILVAFVIGCWMPSLLPGRAAVPILVLLLTGLLLSGTFYSELPPLSAGLLAGAPAATLIAFGKKVWSKTTMWVQAGLVSVAVTTAVGLALHASPPLDY